MEGVWEKGEVIMTEREERRRVWREERKGGRREGSKVTNNLEAMRWREKRGSEKGNIKKKNRGRRR